jgi:hypothetical protein
VSRFAIAPEEWAKIKNPTALRVLIAIGCHANSDGLAWPGTKALSDMTGIDESHIRKIVTAFESGDYAEYVQIVARPKGRCKRGFRLPTRQIMPALAVPPKPANQAESAWSTGQILPGQPGEICLPIEHTIEHTKEQNVEHAADAAVPRTPPSSTDVKELPLLEAEVQAKRPGKKPARLVSSAEREVAGLLRERYEQVLGVAWDSGTERQALRDARRLLDIPGRTVPVIRRAFAAMAADPWWGDVERRKFTSLAALAKKWGDFAPAEPVQPRLAAVPNRPPQALTPEQVANAKRRADREAEHKRRVAAMLERVGATK